MINRSSFDDDKKKNETALRIRDDEGTLRYSFTVVCGSRAGAACIYIY